METHRSFRLTRSDPKADAGKVDISFPVVQQVLVLMMASMILDGGMMMQLSGCAALAYWVGFSIIMARRRGRLTQTDAILIRWGFLMLYTVSFALTGLIWL
jgi:hypothetical protein